MSYAGRYIVEVKVSDEFDGIIKLCKALCAKHSYMSISNCLHTIIFFDRSLAIAETSCTRTNFTSYLYPKVGLFLVIMSMVRAACMPSSNLTNMRIDRVGQMLGCFLISICVFVHAPVFKCNGVTLTVYPVFCYREVWRRRWQIHLLR